MSIDEKIKRADKLINKLIFEARNFIWYAAFQYGTHNYLLAGEKNVKFTYDFEYFTFTKSTKSLLSVLPALQGRQIRSFTQKLQISNNATSINIRIHSSPISPAKQRIPSKM